MSVARVEEHDGRPSHRWQLQIVVRLLAVLLLGSSGCAMGPRALQFNRQKYNESVARTNREELLLNLVRLRYGDTPEVLPIGSIATQLSWDYSANASGAVGQDASNVLNLAGRAAFAERPTVSYAMPQKDVINGFLNPLTTETLFVLTYTGSPAEEVMSVVVKNINKVENAMSAGGLTPEVAPEFEEFRWLIQNVSELRRRRQLEVGRLQRLTPVADPVPRDSLTVADFQTAYENNYVYKPTDVNQTMVLHKKENATFLRFAPEALYSEEYLEIVRILQLAPGLTRYELNLALEGQLLDEQIPSEGRREILLSIRSLLEIMFFLSNGVDVPVAHVAKGLVTITINDQGCPFDWQQVLDNRFRVLTSKQKPHQAAVAVKYRGHWFYIDDRDHTSKSTFILLRKIFALQVQAGGVESLPILTLPIGR